MKPRGDEWFIRKAEYYARHKKVCRACSSTAASGSVHLHHVRYSTTIGAEPDCDLVPLCQDHHRAVHRLHNANRDSLSLYEATKRVIERESGRLFEGGERKKKKGSKQERIIAWQQEQIRELEEENAWLRDRLLEQDVPA